MKKESLTIWHNPNCSKSREAYDILQSNSTPINVFDYLNEYLSKDDIINIMKKLGISDIREMLRSGEVQYKQNDLDNKIQDEIIEVVLVNRILIQRPIIIKNDIAVIARPMENLTKLLGK
jgi:arsenate reductase